MADRTLAQVTVETEDFRNAIQSVSLHASDDEDLPMLTRTHLIFEPNMVTVLATNRYSAALAIASVEDDHAATGEPIEMDLTATQVKELLSLFPAKDGKGDNAVQTMLRLDVTTSYITALDVTGLFPGKTMRWPRVASDAKYPDLRKVIGSKLELVGGDGAVQLHTNGTLLALFRAPARLYGKPLVVEPTAAEKGALVIACGDSFLGLLMPASPDEEQLLAELGWRRDWKRRLGIDELVPA